MSSPAQPAAPSYSEGLLGLCRLWTPEGSHVADGEGTLLCGRPCPEGAAPDRSIVGEAAWQLADCAACKLAAERYVAGAEIERIAAGEHDDWQRYGGQASAPETVTVTSAQGTESAPAQPQAVVRTPQAREEESWRRFWISLVLALAIAAFGFVDLGGLVAFFAALMRLGFCLSGRGGRIRLY